MSIALSEQQEHMGMAAGQRREGEFPCSAGLLPLVRRFLASTDSERYFVRGLCSM